MKRAQERRLLTNPVLILEPRLDRITKNPALWVKKAPRLRALLDELRQDGLKFPPSFIRKVVEAGIIPDGTSGEPLVPGVVGLLWDTSADQGLVAPLKVELLSADDGEDWQVANYLPFKASDLQRLFVALGEALGLPVGVPERLAFRISHELGEEAEGMSMNVAALLAVLGALAQEPSGPLLAGACAVVEPEGSNGQLRASHGISAKLKGFVREYERGTLLVRHHEDEEASAFDEYFDEVWAVESIRQLATHLQDAQLLDGLFQRVELSRGEVKRIQRRLSIFLEELHDYKAARDLSRRVLQCEMQATVSRASREKIDRAWLDAKRHQGSMDILEEERRGMEAAQAQGRYTCFEDIAEKAVNYGASCYDPHLFEEIEEVLEPWLLKVRKEPRLLSPTLRYKLFNTLARAKVALGDGGWRELFESSLDLQAEIDPRQVQRTRNYLIHALLRADAVGDAAAQIGLAQKDPYLGEYSSQFLEFCRADLARRQGRVWVSEQMEGLHQASPGPGHPAGFYLQATARQADRQVEDRVARFSRARRLFLKDLNPDEGEDQIERGNSVLLLLAAAVGMAAAAYGEDRERWDRERRLFEKFIRTRTSKEFARYYRDVSDELGEEPEVILVERLLSKIPFF